MLINVLLVTLAAVTLPWLALVTLTNLAELREAGRRKGQRRRAKSWPGGRGRGSIL